MPGEPVRLGPFIGGLNTLSDPSSLADTELTDCVNLELDLDGSLLSRPPIVVVGPAFTGKVRHLGFMVNDGVIRHFVSSLGKTYFSLDGTNWTDAGAPFAASCMVQYDGKAWLFNSTGAGGYYSLVTDASKTMVAGYNARATMPAADAAVVLKERIYSVPGTGATTNASRLSWSKFIDTTTPANYIQWTSATDFVDVNTGDGENLNDIAVLNDNILLFKSDSTYAFTFDVGPSFGSLRKVSSTIGATKRDCVVLYEQNLYVYHEGNVYEVINYDFSRINTKVPFFYDPSAPSTFIDEVFLSVIGDRLLVRYYNRTYVFGFRTRTWTRWSSSFYFGAFKQSPVSTTVAFNVQYFAGSCVVNDFRVFKFEDGTGSLSELMTCSVKTKNYDLSVSHMFKRLFWWGVDISAKNDVTGTVTPIVFSFSATWNDLTPKRWNELFTWDAPLQSPGGVTSVVSVSHGGYRRFIKFLKSIRFRQVNFQVSTTTHGDTTDAPIRLFTITAITSVKQVVSQKVS